MFRASNRYVVAMTSLTGQIVDGRSFRVFMPRDVKITAAGNLEFRRQGWYGKIADGDGELIDRDEVTAIEPATAGGKDDVG